MCLWKKMTLKKRAVARAVAENIGFLKPFALGKVLFLCYIGSIADIPCLCIIQNSLIK